MILDKRILNFLVIIILTTITLSWSFFIFHYNFNLELLFTVIIIRFISSFLILKDYTQSWSKASPKTFLIKSIVYITPFPIYAYMFYGEIRLAFMISELFIYLFSINFLMYSYAYIINKKFVKKTKSLVIFGSGEAAYQLQSEYKNSEYKIRYFIDDDSTNQKRSIDSIKVVSRDYIKNYYKKDEFDLLIIALPDASHSSIKEIYSDMSLYFKEVKILPSFNDILQDQSFSKQLKNISLEDLLARDSKDLDKDKIKSFIKDKTILITGAGGSIGSEISRQCEIYGAKKLILLDHSEYNLYAINEELENIEKILVMQSVVDYDQLEETFKINKPDIVIHAAAYKHVPLVEHNINQAISNNIIGTKNTIDLAIKYKVDKFIMVSTDKAVRPTNVMGTTKRICELYAQNSNGNGTDIVAVRFGNVLGSSGSVIPKFKTQIENGGPITVTHPDITRYFMLIPEACELVLQAGAIGSGGEIFILDMGKPIKIVDLAKKMIELSGRDDVEIEFSGLRPGEKLYEELLIDEADYKTEYESITVAKPTEYSLDELNNDIEELLECKDKLTKLKEIVPEFNHQVN